MDSCSVKHHIVDGINTIGCVLLYKVRIVSYGDQISDITTRDPPPRHPWWCGRGENSDMLYLLATINISGSVKHHTLMRVGTSDCVLIYRLRIHHHGHEL